MPLDAPDDPIVTTDLDFVIRWCNGAAEQRFGHRAGDLVGQRVDVLVAPPAGEDEVRLRDLLRRGECVYRAHTSARTRDGRVLDVSLTVLPSRDPSGAVTGSMRVYHEHADHTSAHAQAYLAAIVDSADEAILAKDLDGIIRSCNPAAERLFGYTARELIGRPVHILIPRERLTEEDEILARLRRGERIDHLETVRMAKDGRRLDIALTVRPVRDANGTIIGASKIARDISERRRLSTAQAHLAAIIDSADDAIIAKDLDGIIQSCNPAAERLFGYSTTELVGRPVRMLIPPERQAEEDEILRRLRRGERIDHFETVRVAKDGRRLDISLTISPVRDASGTIIGASKIARDITEQRRAANEMAAQQEWFRVTLSSIGDAVIAADINGHVSFLNAAAEAVTGWPVTEAAGRPLVEVFNIVNEATRRPVENPAVLVMRSGHVVGLANHTVLIARDGTERPIADSAAPIRDRDGHLIGVVLVFRDVSKERQAEDAIAEQREWFRKTLESIGDAVIATDVQGRVVFMNSVAEHLTGWRATEAQDRPCTEVFDIINEMSRRPVDSPVARVLAEGTVVGLANHTVLIAADGTERPIEDSGAPIRNRDGRIVGTVLVFRDVSERRRLESERQRGTTERERLLEAERAARADAERASRVKDEFVAMVSHELRTPLNAILGWTQLTLRSKDDPRAVERGLDVIARNTRVQAQLISDLLDISRIVAGKLTLEVRPVDLHAIVADAIETVQQEAHAKSVDLRARLADEIGAIAGDPARLQQIVWNLLSNAVKFTPEGGHITVDLHRLPDAAEVAVTDDGVGIRADFLPHVFDRFHQADRSITRRFGGLGLGLSIVKHLVELHGGRVRAESQGEGKGATFVVTLPTSRVLPAPAATPSETSVSDRHAGPAVALDGLRILVVEDEPDTLEFLTRLLVGHGAAVTAASSARDALALLATAAPHLLLSDIGLPEVDGYDFIREVRRIAHAGSLPAIALTAYARSEDRMRALRAGYQAHVVKPVEAGELLATLKSLADLVDSGKKRVD